LRQRQQHLASSIPGGNDEVSRCQAMDAGSANYNVPNGTTTALSASHAGSGVHFFKFTKYLWSQMYRAIGFILGLV
jgi:Na+/H+ antiporter NhaC